MFRCCFWRFLCHAIAQDRSQLWFSTATCSIIWLLHQTTEANKQLGRQRARQYRFASRTGRAVSTPFPQHLLLQARILQ